jgi:hypothetical protein
VSFSYEMYDRDIVKNAYLFSLHFHNHNFAIDSHTAYYCTSICVVPLMLNSRQQCRVIRLQFVTFSKLFLFNKRCQCKLTQFLQHYASRQSVRVIKSCRFNSSGVLTPCRLVRVLRRLEIRHFMQKYPKTFDGPLILRNVGNYKTIWHNIQKVCILRNTAVRAKSYVNKR